MCREKQVVLSSSLCGEKNTDLENSVRESPGQTLRRRNRLRRPCWAKEVVIGRRPTCQMLATLCDQFRPTVGREQAGHRPAVVLIRHSTMPDESHDLSPCDTQIRIIVRGYYRGLDQGQVLADQVKGFIGARGGKAGKGPFQRRITEVRAKLKRAWIG